MLKMKKRSKTRGEISKLEEITRRIKDERNKSRDRIRKGASIHI